MVARLVRDQEVACSNPVTSTNQNASELSLAFLLFIPINNFVCKAAEPVGCGRRLPQKCERGLERAENMYLNAPYKRTALAAAQAKGSAKVKPKSAF